MKKYLIPIAILFLSVTLSSNELSWVDTQIEAIKPPRKGMSESEIINVNNPFIYLKSEDKKSKLKGRRSARSGKGINNISQKVAPKRLILSAIINNSALINGKWYNLNDKVRDYKLSSVGRASIILSKGKKKLVLTTNDTSRNIKFK